MKTSIWNRQEEVCELYRSGLTMQEIAKRVGTSSTLIREMLIEAGVPRRKSGSSGPRPRHYKEVGEPTARRWVDLYRKGWTLTQIQDREGYSAGKIRSEIIKRGVQMRGVEERNQPKRHVALPKLSIKGVKG